MQKKAFFFTIIFIALIIFGSTAVAQECVDTAALANYITQWKTNSDNFTMPSLMLKIADWKSGANCTANLCENGVQDGNEIGTDCGGTCYFECPSNFNSGISMVLLGTPGKDYAEEYFFFDKSFDDHRVVYIKDSTQIKLFHNENNSILSSTTCQGTTRVVGTTGPDGIENNGDEGKLLFRIDRDEQAHAFLGSDSINISYAQPFSLSQLSFETGEKIVGTTGSNNGAYGTTFINTTQRYNRGVLDEFGDEWHFLKAWDDDTGISCEHPRYTASDSKIFYFVVNPKTPAIFFKTKNEAAQFYSTPPKAYHAPVVYAQTTYVTDNVDIQLLSLQGADVFYKIDNGQTQTFSSPISTNLLSDGQHFLEYWFDNSYHKKRIIIKNPDYPSKNESHGNILWADNAELLYLQSKLLREPYKSNWSQTKTNISKAFESNKNAFPLAIRPVERGWTSLAPHVLNFSLYPLLDAQVLQTQKTAYFELAKKMLLQFFVADPLGAEFNSSSSSPALDRLSIPNSGTNSYYGIPIAYDLLIKNFKKTDGFEKGITPIEDLKIRDNLASEAFELMQERNKVQGPSPTNPFEGYVGGDLHWGLGYELLLYSFGRGMPSYDSKYYGTSGFDGTIATHNWTPYSSQTLSWKQATLEITPAPGHPNNTFSRRCERAYENYQKYVDYPTALNTNYDLPLDGIFWTAANAFVCCPKAYVQGTKDPSTLLNEECISYADETNCEQYGLTTLYTTIGKVCQKGAWKRSYNLPECNKEGSAVFHLELGGYEAPFVENLVLTTILHKRQTGQEYCANASEYLQTKMRRMLGNYASNQLKNKGTSGNCLSNTAPYNTVYLDNSLYLICSVPLELYNPTIQNTKQLIPHITDPITIGNANEYYFWSKKFAGNGWILNYVFFENNEAKYT